MTEWSAFEIQREDREGATWLIVSGELDLSAAAKLGDEVDGLAAAAGPLTIDLSAVSFCDSSGLAALLRARRQLPEVSFKPGDGVRVVAELGCVADLLFGDEPPADNGLGTGIQANGG